MSTFITDRDFGDENDYGYDEGDDFDWVFMEPEEFVIDDESWEELARRLAEDEEEEND